MNKKAVEQLTEAVIALRANGFESLSEAAVFCAAANATVNDEPLGVSDIARATNIPMSSASRYVWDLQERGLVEYVSHQKDRRMKLVRARLDTLKSNY
jgi:DNA-binding MarR family transcriptional regulator